MRVTSQMIFSQTVFNLSNSVNRLMRIENQLSTGRRINIASDDPIGTQHDLNYRARLQEIDQYKSNISMGTSSLTTHENDLSNLTEIYSAAKEVALMMANDTYDEVAREAAANEIESLLQQVLQIGNNRMDGRYLYAGHRTHTQPLEASSNGVVYLGDTGQVALTIDTDTRVTTNLLGEDIFFKQIGTLGSEADLALGLTGATPVSDLNMGDGVDLTSGLFPGCFAIYDANRNITYEIDVSGCVTVGDVVNAINDPVTGLPADSNLQIKISDAGASFTWDPEIGSANTVTDDTPLSNLNEGAGIDTSLGKFNIRNADSSISFDVDVSADATLGEVITSIESALDVALGVGHGVTVGYNADGTGLQISDTNGVPLGLIIEDYSEADSTVASDLGIAGNLDPDMVGGDLRPRPDFIISDIMAQTTAADLGLTGTVNGDFVGADINPRLTLDSPLSALNNKNGFDLGLIQISQGDRTLTLNLDSPAIVTVGDLLGVINGSGLDISASLNADETGIQIEPTITGQTLIIENADSTQTASRLGLIGSTDMLGSLIMLTTALHDNDRELAEQLVGNLDNAMQGLLVSRGTVGARINQMQITLNRHDVNALNFTKMLSEVEDADIVTLVTDLAKEENLYQAALMASSKIIQPSLLDFLR